MFTLHTLTLIWKKYLYLGIWNYDRTKIIVLPSLQLATRLHSQNRNETEFNNEHWHINLYMNIGNSHRHNWNFTQRKWSFLIYFSSLHDYRPPSTWNVLVHISWVKWSDVKMCFSAPQNAKKKISWNKNQERNTLFIDS